MDLIVCINLLKPRDCST